MRLWRNRLLTIIGSTLVSAVTVLALSGTPAHAATWTTVNGWVNTNGSWTQGQVQRYFAGGNKQIHFYATNLPGCCLDVQDHEWSSGFFWGGVWNIQSAQLGVECTLTTGYERYNVNAQCNGEIYGFDAPYNGGFFRIWHRNSVVGSDNAWTGQLAYNYPA